MDTELSGMLHTTNSTDGEWELCDQQRAGRYTDLEVQLKHCIADAADVGAVTLRPLACLLNIGSVILERTMETVDQRTASRQAQLSLQRVLSDGTS